MEVVAVAVADGAAASSFKFRNQMASIIFKTCIFVLSMQIFGELALSASTEFGICYGMIADNLPPPVQVTSQIKTCGFAKFRLYDPQPEVMNVTDRLITIGTRNEDLPKLASDPQFAMQWIQNNCLPYNNVLDITVGNEVIPGQYAKYVVPAIRNLRIALDQSSNPKVMVTTAIYGAALANSYPPSSAVFAPGSIDVMTDLVQYFASLPPGHQPNLYIHVYPYFAHAGDPANVPLDFALFEMKEAKFHDGDLSYTNLFDSMYDGFVWALEKIGGGSIGLTVGETGWPSAGGGQSTTPETASTYLANLYDHYTKVGGSPKRPNGFGDLFVFAMFNENLKRPGVERNWGLFNPNLQHVYDTPFCL